MLVLELLFGTPGTIAVPVTGPGDVAYADVINGNPVSGKKKIYPCVLSGRLFLFLTV